MIVRSLFATLLATAAIGLAFAQAPTPQPAPPAAVASGELPIPPAPAPKVSKAWVLLDYATGQVLAGDNADAQVEPASITKVMTSYVIAAEMAHGKVKADDPVMMTENAWRTGGAGTDGSYSGFEVNKTAPLVEVGGRAAGSIAEAVAVADVVALMLPDTPDVTAVLTGPDGVFENARPGTLIIERSLPP